MHRINLYNEYHCKTSTIGLYEGQTTHARIKTTEKIQTIDNDCKIYYNGIDYFLCVPKVIEKKDQNTTKKWFAALDPGSRKFQVLCNPEDNEYVQIGVGASKVLHQNLIHLDKLISKGSSNKKIAKQRNQISNLQDEMHFKVCKYLCDTYQTIYIPKLTRENDIIRLTDRYGRKRKINSKTVRMMSVLGHCKFIERLKTKAQEYPDVNIHIITEEYTSQTCLRCEYRTKTACEIFKCSECDFTIDRDILGSTNILYKNW